MAVTSCNLENASDTFNKRGKYLPEFVVSQAKKTVRVCFIVKVVRASTLI